MSRKEPYFDTGRELLQWRQRYFKEWIMKNHPALSFRVLEDSAGSYRISMCLSDIFSTDSVLMSIHLDDLMEQSKEVLGKAVTMKGFEHFTAPVMCERVEKTIKRTGNYSILEFLDAIARRERNRQLALLGNIYLGDNQ